MDNVIQNIKVEDIVLNNDYHQYNEKEITELAASIKQLGILEPITIRPKNEKYELVLGKKRYKAAIMIGLKTIPCIIKNLDDNKIKEYLTINNDTLIMNNSNTISNSITKNLDVINLSKLNEEYERDELKMNNNQFENNNFMQQPSNNEPTFGGRFFPSLEDEPTNMSFNNEINQQIKPQETPQTPNNFIDLTDLNIGQQPIQQPQQSTPVTDSQFINAPQSNVNDSIQNMMPNLPTEQNVQQMPQTQINENNNIINLESLKQNPEMGTQPINENMNIDNNFQEIISDFSAPTNNMINNQPEILQPNFDMPTPNYNMNENNNITDSIPSFNEQPQTFINYEINQPNIESTIPEPIIPQQDTNQFIAPQEITNQVSPVLESTPKKDVLPVINTLKALAINLETFGYTIRITDEDLDSTYKITIEVDK